MPATIPTTAPLMSLVTFSVISALASSISSRTSSDARSETSWIARPSSEVDGLVGHSVHQSLEDAGEHEGAGEGGADQDLGAVGAFGRLGAGRCAVAPRAAAAAALGSVSLPMPGDATLEPDTLDGGRRGARSAASRRLRSASSASARSRSASRSAASACSCAFCSLRDSFSSRSRGLLDGVLRLGGLLLRAARVGGGQLAAQLGAAGLGPLALGGLLGLCRRSRASRLVGLRRVLVFGHSGGSSPNTRR